MKVFKMALAAVAVMGLSSTVLADGEDTYKKTCFACHEQGVAGAPKFGDKEAWKPRIETGMDALLNSVKNGKNAMPAKGTCSDCSDDELKAAIEYMTGKSK